MNLRTAAQHYNRMLGVWRQQYNPLRALSITRIVGMLEQNEYGYHAELQWLYRFIEKRDATLRALKWRRLSSLKRLNWTVKVKEEFANERDAKIQQVALTEVYNGIDNLKKSFEFLALASFRGYSHLEKHFDGEGNVTHLEPVPQWFWTQKFPDMSWLFNKTAQQTNNGVPIDPESFIIRECDDAINEVAVVAFIRKNMSQKDWDGFVETYGIPPLFLEMPEDTVPEQVAGYQEISEKLVSDGRGTLPAGAKVQNVETALHGTPPFKEHIGYQDEQVVLAGTSGKLTMLNDPTGLGSGQSEVHAGTFNELAVAEAEEISEIFGLNIDEPFLDEKFPDQSRMVYFALEAQDQEDVDKLVAHVATLKSAGYEMEEEDLEERTGYKLTPVEPVAQFETMEGEPGLDQQMGGRLPPILAGRRVLNNRGLGPMRGLEENTRTAVLTALASEVQELNKRMEAIAGIEDKGIRNRKLKALKSQLPEILRALNSDPAAAGPMLHGMTAGLFNGLDVNGVLSNRMEGLERAVTSISTRPIEVKVLMPTRNGISRIVKDKDGRPVAIKHES